MVRLSDNNQFRAFSHRVEVEHGWWPCMTDTRTVQQKPGEVVTLAIPTWCQWHWLSHRQVTVDRSRSRTQAVSSNLSCLIVLCPHVVDSALSGSQSSPVWWLDKPSNSYKCYLFNGTNGRVCEGRLESNWSCCVLVRQWYEPVPSIFFLSILKFFFFSFLVWWFFFYPVQYQATFLTIHLSRSPLCSNCRNSPESGLYLINSSPQQTNSRIPLMFLMPLSFWSAISRLVCELKASEVEQWKQTALKTQGTHPSSN